MVIPNKDHAQHFAGDKFAQIVGCAGKVMRWEGDEAAGQVP